MKRWIWFVVAIFISTGVYFTIRYGLQPKAIPVLNPTMFEDTQQIGAVIYRRLRQEIRMERVILLGSAPELANDPSVWSGFIKTAGADGVKIDVLFQREGLTAPEMAEKISGTTAKTKDLGRGEILPFTEESLHSGKLIPEIKSRLQAGHLVVIHALTPEVTHLMNASLSRELDTLFRHPVLSLSTLRLTLQPGEQNTLLAYCLDPTMANEGKTRLECAQARAAKLLLKKKANNGKIWAVAERHGLKEYLIFIHR